MRRFLLAAAMFATMTSARAADMPDFLRGGFAPVPVVRNWAGWYVGGQADYSVANIDLGHGQQSPVDFILRNTLIQGPVDGLMLFGRHHEQSAGFGGFVGRNWQWDDVVLGVEANYVHLSDITAFEQNSIARRFDNPFGQTLPAGHIDRYDVTVTGAAQMQIKDVMTFRGRAGWICGDFLPYAFGGLAVGRLATSRSATVTVDEFDVFTTTTPRLSRPPLRSRPSRGRRVTQGRTPMRLAGPRASEPRLLFSETCSPASNGNISGSLPSRTCGAR